MISSEIYGVIDCIFIDYAVDGQKNDNWENFGNRLTIVTDSTGTTLTGATNNGYYFVNASDKFIFNDYVCEFDVITLTGNPRWYHQGESTGNENVFIFNQSWFNEPLNHVRITVSNGVARLTVNDVERGNTTLSTVAPYEIGFRTPNGTNHTLTYKDLKVYPV